jgi:hypothetical protein
MPTRLSAQEIYNLYRAGVRDFREVTIGGRRATRTRPYRANMNGCRFFGADFSRSKLSGFGFRSCDLSTCKFSKTDLRWTDFNHSTLRNVDFRNADLRNTDLADTDLSGSDFTEADLRDADIWGSVFSNTNLTASKLSGAVLGGSTFINFDLTPVCENIDSIRTGPSYIDWTTVLRSAKNDNLHEVLVKFGMPDILADYSIDWARSETTDVFRIFRSVFLIYGGPDERFARVLEARLRQGGISTYFFPKHAVLGERIHIALQLGINSHDRAILICTKSSLDRPGVLSEIEAVLAREHRNGGDSLLIPITLDDYVYKWNPKRRGLGDAIRDRVIGDFRNAHKNDGILNTALPRLLAALRLPDRIRQKALT